MPLEDLYRLANYCSLFGCWDGPDGDVTRFRGDSFRSLRIGRRLENQTEPGTFLADPPSDLGGVFTDPGGKNQAIQPAKRRGQGTQFPDDTINK